MAGSESSVGRNRPWEVLVNRRAGRRGKPVEAVQEALRRAGVDARLHLPEAAEEGRQLARSFAHQEVVVAVLGGDGTVNDIGAQLVGGNAWLAMLPGGTENLMCRSAGSPAADAGAAVEHLLQAKPVRWDVGILGDRLFFGIAGIGFDAQICARAEGVWRQRLGQLMYWLTAAAQVPRKPQRYTLKWPGGQLSGVHEAIFSNVNRYGGGLVVNAQADPTDGWLDLAVFPWTGYLGRVGQFLTLLPWSWAQKFPGPARVRIQRAEISAEEALWAHVDGEPFLVRNPSLSLRAGALWVLQDVRAQSG